jgi:hypothetical protein
MHAGISDSKVPICAFLDRLSGLACYVLDCGGTTERNPRSSDYPLDIFLSAIRVYGERATAALPRTVC